MVLDVKGGGGKQGRKGNRSNSRLYCLLLSVVATVAAACMQALRLSTKSCAQIKEVKAGFLTSVIFRILDNHRVGASGAVRYEAKGGHFV